MPPGRPSKPNSKPRTIKMDDDLWTSLGDAADSLDVKRSAVIETLILKYLPGHLSAHWRAQDKAKGKKPARARKP